MANYFIFRCSNTTHDECLKRKLFGQTDNMDWVVKKIKPGDILFLHNTTAQILEGPFFAVSNGEKNIIPDAWGGGFPQQVKVETKGDISKINKNSFDKFGLRYAKDNKYFELEIPSEVGRKLMEEMGIKLNIVNRIIDNYNPIEDKDIDIRLRFPAKYRCSDGHYVRSKNEVIVDNWLFNYNIAHSYEPKVLSHNILSDFLIKNKNSENVFIEVWGLDDPVYLKRKKQKEEIYKKENLNLISITEREIQNIDDLLKSELSKYKIM